MRKLSPILLACLFLLPISLTLLPWQLQPLTAIPLPPSHTLTTAVPPLSQLQTHALTLYQPLQTIPWEGQFRSPKNLVYFAQAESLNLDSPPSVLESDLAAARSLQDTRKAAQLLLSLGLQSYLEKDWDTAIANYQQGLIAAKQIGDSELSGTLLGNLGLAYAQASLYTESIDALTDYWQFVRDYTSAKNPDRRNEEIALGNLGNAYYSAELYVKAIEFHQKRLALAKAGKNHSGEAKALGDLSLVYQALGEYEKAIALQQQQLTLTRQIKDLRGESLALANLGLTYHSLGDYTKAASNQQQRLTLARQIHDRKAEAEALVNLAGADYFLGNDDRAIDLYEQAWQIAWNFLQDADVLYGLRGNEGLVYFQTGDIAKALAAYQQAFTYASSRSNRRSEGVVKNNIAILHWLNGDLPATAKALRESIAAWESLRSRLGNRDGYKVSLFETQNAPYINLQRVLIAQQQPEAALEIAERGRARVFAELLTRRLTPDQIQQPHQAMAPVPPDLAQIRTIAQQHHATLITYSILSEQFKIQNRLQTQESTLLIWVIQPTGTITLRQVDLNPLWQQQKTTLADLVSSSRESIGVRGRGANPAAPIRAIDSQLLRQLHQLLIAPIADLLPQNPADPVIFIPQRSLFLVPFAALQDSQGRYLIEQHTLSIAPSIQVLDLTHQLRQKSGNSLQAKGTALVVGNPTMPKVVVEAGEPPEQLASLPGAEQEAVAIAQILKTQPLIEANATKVKVVQQMAQAKHVHLATHGLLDDFQGLGIPGAIALAPSGTDNGLLTAAEILNLQLAAELVVLSACDTGGGRITGDGVIGLSRSLISAGVPSVVVSLWAVPDAPTAALMIQFYQNLQKGLDKAHALRQAMLVTQSQYPDPKDWAAFTLIGETN
ncbi:MAG: CHAT domain-containing protein [Scytolyngbya sp. HA4215-MV1]|jgi:CHAT domain-containing protein|nr:CHAT domain-containing protein [Scytolyngbya sp. HA4215-MV1]